MGAGAAGIRPVRLIDTDTLPTLYRDHCFWGMIVTQFLGAFNDNLFKQLMLLLALKVAGQDRQWEAMFVFSAPFVIFSGYAGYLADRHSKRAIIVLAKVAEILVMLMGLAAFLSFDRWGFAGLFVVLFPDGHAQRVLRAQQVRHPARDVACAGFAAGERHHLDDDVPGDHFRHGRGRRPVRPGHRTRIAARSHRTSTLDRLGGVHGDCGYGDVDIAIGASTSRPPCRTCNSPGRP